MRKMLMLEQITKGYGPATPVLSGVDLEVQPGESLAIVGESGCGKSTLLNIIGSLDQPDSGSVCVDGEDLLSLNEKELAAFRNRRVGFVFQLHHLLPQCTVLENVMVPSLIQSGSVKDRAVELLDRVGLSHRLDHRPGELSGGERQRVAVVRALINRPSLLLADEPTGALNEAGASELLDLLLELNRDEGLTLIMVTHSMPLAERLDRVVTLSNGALQ
ncbi:ABC transporter ATP-binding protein [Pontiellaceae bacterium B12227]|nr:ABC transporter ATP-binding protein [Pontiellaceae bacterium B12227]